MVEFGDRLRQFRKERKLTQKELATLIGVKNSVISFYEVGDRKPSLEALIKLSKALHISTDILLGIEKSETIDISGLSEKDKQYIQALVDRLRNK
ncbi:MAG: helix-turn-helix transcriptional regulator [Ruminococcaceae bacterium]|nr:helix-turn-helix transcriptional regulator [Oscillospiraceae bacterium]